ncbi:MAG: hypothetical protein U5R14_02115 [Gemmatimonadota bacterium]|nr:hypothetical protein [Gemmatimonadota bacterium]
MNQKLRSMLPVLLSLGAAALLFLGVDRILERQRVSSEITRLRSELFQARASAQRCRGTVESSETRLREFDDVITSLRSQVDSFEALDARGVPEDQYDEYMESFERYNDSVDAWDARVERLRNAEAACRSTIERHNALRDSLQTVLDEAGVATSDSTS